MKLIRLVMLCAILLASVSCRKDDICNNQEVTRESSPDNVVDALVIQTNCGATTSYSYRVFITQIGKRPTNNSILLADKVENLNISWTSSNDLLITYSKARIFEFTNFWQSKDIDNFQYIVSISERKR